jgi:hypothetical protein
MSSAIGSGRVRAARKVRHAIVVAAVALVGWVGFGLWWNWSLAGLPEIGDPFDVAAFERSRLVEPDEDALPLYRQATTLLNPRGSSRRTGGDEAPYFLRWEAADPAERGRLDENRAALDVWLKATEKQKCSLEELSQLFVYYEFMQQAGLEASRLEASGDFKSAWTWYRAILRSMDHGERGLGIAGRRDQLRVRAALAEPVLRWAADGRVDVKTLRGALADLVALHEGAPREIDTYKTTYIELMHIIEVGATTPTNYIGPVVPLLGVLPSSTNRVWMPMRQEPERSRRVLRLIFANWLAWEGRPRAERPGPLPHDEEGPILYPLPPDAPASARALPPERLTPWYRSSSYARFLYLGQDDENLCEYVIVRERAARAHLIVAVAEQIYRREHGGQAPPSREALVGPYLKRLPDGLDGPLPKVEE